MAKVFSHTLLMFVASLALVALLGVADYYTSWEFSVAIFYLLPLFICVHYVGKWPGLVVALVCGATLIGVDLGSDPRPPYPTFVAVWNGLALLSFFVIFTLLLSSLESAVQREKNINSNLEALLTLAPYDERGWQLPSQNPPAQPPAGPQARETEGA